MPNYVSMPLLPAIGNFGSQLQQYASILSIAKQNNKKVIFPKYSLSLDNSHGFRIIEAFDLDITFVDDDFKEDFVYWGHNTQKEVDENVFNLEPDKNYIFTNRFNSFKYWYPYIRETIYEKFVFFEQIEKEANEMLKDIKSKNSPIVSMHARKGDYLDDIHLNVYCQLDFTYYKKALDSLKETDPTILLFSNDIEWCQNHLNQLSPNIYYVKGSNDYVDMCLMSKCDHNIIANSFFSWWAALLNKHKNKKIVCPKNYVKNNINTFINGNYYPEEWYAIDNDDS
jgi:hypothetical protein